MSECLKRPKNGALSPKGVKELEFLSGDVRSHES
jgi:hypothetical protein